MLRRDFLGSVIALPAAAMLAPSIAHAEAHGDIATAPTCHYCGMDRTKFGHSRMVVEYEDGNTVGTCSLHCLAVELALSIDRFPKSIRVADLGTKELVDAETAVWVIGGSKQGVMTGRAKWAFASRAPADAFVKENGGRIATFDEAIKASYEDMYQDTKAIRERRKHRRARMNEMKKS